MTTHTAIITCRKCGRTGVVDWPDDLLILKPRCGWCGSGAIVKAKRKPVTTNDAPQEGV